jgi:phospholipid-binding lipoprotein MlaA
VRLLAGLLGMAVLAGCATGPDADPRDPLEPWNRAVYQFNDDVDHVLATPVARVYRNVLPVGIRDRVRNFFANIADPFIGVNNVLQGKIEDGFLDGMRFVVNSTIGLFGIHDVATDMGLEKHNEDFGQTFGRWGVGPGPYLVLPIFGSSDLRDGVGFVVDIYADPLTNVRPHDVQYLLYGLRFTQTRTDLLEASRILEEAALDKYTFQRDAYLQRRRSLVYDGRPPRERELEDEDDNKPN